jgi:inhibitor of cysteine peptidase
MHDRAVRSWIALLAAALLVASCGGDDASAVVLEQTDSGSEVTLDVGDRVDVQLDANPTTGYRWELAPLPDGIVLVSSDFEEPGGSLVGAPGTQTFVFDAVAAGSGILRLEYIRPFDDLPVADKIVEYVLTITD